MRFLLLFRNEKNYHHFLTFFTFAISLLSVILLMVRVFIHPQFVQRLLATSFYFTTQSNFIVWFVMLFYILRFNHKRWHEVLSFIALVNITITAIVFHVFLRSYLEINLMQHVLHTLVPICFIIFYFLILTPRIVFKDLWIAFLHPLIFMVSVYVWIGPLFGNMLENIFPDFDDAKYIYPFLNPNNYDSFLVYATFNFLLLPILILCIALILIYLKLKYEQRVHRFYQEKNT